MLLQEWMQSGVHQAHELVEGACVTKSEIHTRQPYANTQIHVWDGSRGIV